MRYLKSYLFRTFFFGNISFKREILFTYSYKKLIRYKLRRNTTWYFQKKTMKACYFCQPSNLIWFFIFLNYITWNISKAKIKLLFFSNGFLPYLNPPTMIKFCWLKIKNFFNGFFFMVQCLHVTVVISSNHFSKNWVQSKKRKFINISIVQSIYM